MNWKVIIFSLVLIAVVGGIIYSNSLAVPFIFDDVDSIVENPARRSFDLAWYDWLGSRTVGYFTLDLSYYWSGLEVKGYHIMNIGIHILASIAVYWLVFYLSVYLYPIKEWRVGWLKFSNHQLLALMAGLIFVSHPIQTQAVTYVVQRIAALTALFYVVALLGYVRFRTSGSKRAGYIWAIVSLLATVLAMHTKENAITIPVVIVLMEGLFFGTSLRSWKKRWWKLLPWVILIIIIPAYMLGARDLFVRNQVPISEIGLFNNLNLKGISRAARENNKLDRYSYFLTQFRVVRTYLRLMVLPINQHLDYYYPLSTSIKDGRVIGSAVIHLGMLITAIWLWIKKYRMAAFGILFFYIALLPESSLVPITDAIFEHRLYLPLLGLVMVLVEIGAWWLGRRENKAVEFGKTQAASLMVAVSLLIAVLGWATWQRNIVWQSKISIWQDSANKSPLKGRPHNNLGLHLLTKGETGRAVTAFTEAIMVDETYAEPHNNLGMILIQKGKLDEAEVELEEALRLKPIYPHAMNNLGAIYLQRKETDKAEEMFRQAISNDNRYAGARDNLGMVLIQTDRLAEAIEMLEINVEQNPDFVTSYNNLGVAYFRLKRLKEARDSFKRALQIDPGYKRAEANLKLLDKRSTTQQAGLKVFR